jgi:hypothetical protein
VKKHQKKGMTNDLAATGACWIVMLDGCSTGAGIWPLSGMEENKASLKQQKQFEAEIKSLHEQMRIDKPCSDFKEQAAMLHKEIDEEKAGQHEWTLHKAEIDS